MSDRSPSTLFTLFLVLLRSSSIGVAALRFIVPLFSEMIKAPSLSSQVTVCALKGVVRGGDSR